jgi:hypothetical protein
MSKDKLTPTVQALSDLAAKSGLPAVPSGIVLLYPEQAHLVVLLGEFPAGPEREDLRQSLISAAEDL